MSKTKLEGLTPERGLAKDGIEGGVYSYEHGQDQSRRSPARSSATVFKKLRSTGRNYRRTGTVPLAVGDGIARVLWLRGERWAGELVEFANKDLAGVLS